MIRYHFLAASILLSTTFSAETLLSHQAGTFFTSTDLGEIHQRAQKDEDFVVLSDGIELTGEIQTLPPLRYSFGTLPIDINDVAAIAFSVEEGRGKMQVVTQDDYSFVCDVPKETIRLVQYFPSRENYTRTINHEVNPKTISHIFFRGRGESTHFEPRKLYVLGLNNGDQLPVVIRDERLHLSNGWRDFILHTDRIIDVSFDGGLYGRLDGEKGGEEELDYSFVRGRFLHIQVAKTPQILGIPWDHVQNIRKIDTTVLQDNAALKGLSQNNLSANKITEPSRLFTEESIKVDQDEIVWIPNETIDGFVVEGDESERILAVADTSIKSKYKQSESLAKLSRKNQDFQEELEELRTLDATWEARNGEIRSKLNSCSESQEELLRRQDLLVSHLELELTRTKQLKNALNDAVAKWDKAKTYSKVMEKRLKDILGGKNLAFSSIENEADLFVEVNAHKKALEEERALTIELEKQVYHLNNALEEGKQKKNQEQQNVLTYQNEIAQLTEELEKEERYTKELEDKLIEMSVEVGEFEKKFDAVKDSVMVKKEEIEELQESHDSLYESLLQKIGILTQEKRTTEERQGELEAKINDLVLNFTSEKDYSDELQQQLNDMAGMASSFEDQLAAINEVVEETAGDILEETEKEDAASKEVSEKIDALTEELNNEKERANSLKEELQEAIARSELTESETGFLEQQLNETVESAREQGRTVSTLENEVAVNVTELNQKEQQVNDLLVRLAEYENDIEQYEQQIQTIESKLEEFEKENEAQVGMLTQRVEELHDSLEKYQKENEELQLLIRNYEEQKLELEDEVALRQRSLDEVKEQNQARSVDNAFKLQELEIQLGDTLDNYEQLQVLKSEVEEQLAYERKHYADVEEGYSQSEKTLEERNEELQNFSNAYSLMQNKLVEKIDFLQRSVEEERNRVQELQNVIETQSNDAVSIQELETRLELALSDFGDIQNEKQRLEEETKSSNAALSEKIGELESLSTDYVERQTQLNEQVELLQNTIEEERSYVQDLEEEIETQTQKNATTSQKLETRLESAFSDLGDIQNEKQRLEEEVESSNAAFAEKTGELESLSMDSVERQTQLNEQVELLQNTIEEERSYVQDLEEEIETQTQKNATTSQELEAKWEEIRRELESSQNEKRNLEKEFLAVQTAYAEKSDQLQNLAKDHAEMQGEFLEQIEILQLTIEEEQKLIKFLQNEIGSRTEENSSTRHDLEARLDEAMKDLEQAKEQKRSLEEKLGELNRKIERLEA
ncbi:MAG: Chromosome partition protein Smc [Chlamydiae bacterium]|nr:Chromosome partition protein Smc [Chlamydiota bacterium]